MTRACIRVSVHNKEAAELMRDNEPAFRDKVKRSLRGGSIDGFTFPKLV